MEGKPLLVQGMSMRPFLKDQDLVWLGPLERKSLKRGQLVYAIRNESREVFVHRVIKNGWIKGDRVKQPDQVLKGGVTVLGVIQGRIVLRKNLEFKLVPYQSRSIQLLHQFQALLSEWNQWHYLGFHRIASVLLIIFGYLIRNFELYLAPEIHSNSKE